MAVPQGKLRFHPRAIFVRLHRRLADLLQRGPGVRLHARPRFRTRLILQSHLQPGGYFEQIEMSVVPKSDDGTVTPDSIFELWGKTSLLLGDKFGKSLRTVDESKAGMEAAGFVNVVEHRWKLPIGGWAADKRYKEIGQYNRIHWEQGIEGWSLYLLTTLLHWSVEEVQVYLARVRQALKDRRIHAYQEV
jgi:hypothetical protein